jgi:hypothetical protein
VKIAHPNKKAFGFRNIHIKITALKKNEDLLKILITVLLFFSFLVVMSFTSEKVNISSSTFFFKLK